MDGVDLAHTKAKPLQGPSYGDLSTMASPGGWAMPSLHSNQPAELALDC